MGLIGYHWDTVYDPDYVRFEQREETPEEKELREKMKQVLMTSLLNRTLLPKEL